MTVITGEEIINAMNGRHSNMKGIAGLFDDDTRNEQVKTLPLGVPQVNCDFLPSGSQ